VANGVRRSFGRVHAVRNVTLEARPGRVTGLVGPNGSGKTTLLETLLGKREPDAGSARLGHGVEAAYFSQHEVELDPDLTVLGQTQQATGLNRPEAQNLLGRFLFSGWDIHERRVGALSGGERRRLALALVVASGANFLVLDEPTNHLDLESREALEAALEAFPGTVLLVSHDRALLDAVAGRTLAIEDRTLHSYDGGWADYVEQRAERAERTEPEPEPAAKPEPKARTAKPKTDPRPRELEDLEVRIEAQETVIRTLESRLADDWGDVDAIAAHRRARDELQALLGRWETLVDEVSA
jgi:ATP-binding cassette subfamily F protein 3